MAAHESAIYTWGAGELCLNLGLRYCYLWRFIVDDVSWAIIETDLHANYDFLVDLKNSQVTNEEIKHTSHGRVSVCNVPSVKLINLSELVYH